MKAANTLQLLFLIAIFMLTAALDAETMNKILVS
jgi:hypothetical protein